MKNRKFNIKDILILAENKFSLIESTTINIDDYENKLLYFYINSYNLIQKTIDIIFQEILLSNVIIIDEENEKIINNNYDNQVLTLLWEWFCTFNKNDNSIKKYNDFLNIIFVNHQNGKNIFGAYINDGIQAIQSARNFFAHNLKLTENDILPGNIKLPNGWPISTFDAVIKHFDTKIKGKNITYFERDMKLARNVLKYDNFLSYF